MASNSIILKSKLNTKEWFDIILHSTVSGNENLYQELEYRLDNNENWEKFIFYNDGTDQRKCVYAYMVELRNYVQSTNDTPITEDIINNFQFGIEINDIDDMTAQELLGQIETLRNELTSLKSMLSSYVSNTTIDLYASKNWVEDKNYLTSENLQGLASESYVINKINDIDLNTYATKSYVINKINDIDLSTYATESYVMNKINNLDINGVSLEGYATESYVMDKINNLDINDISLDGYATESYVLDKISNIDVSSINIDLSDYATISYVNDKVSDLDELVSKYTSGPFAYFTNAEISYNEYLIEDMQSLFTYNDLYEYTFGNPYLENTYVTQSIWTYLGESPYPSNSNGSSTLKENKDIKDFIYKVNVKSTNYDQNSYLTQKCKERIYFLQGDSLTLDSYNQKNINLTTYIATNCITYSVDNVDWVTMPNLTTISLSSNVNSTENRTVNITITESNNTEHIFSITQPGNPDYDPNSGSGDTPVEEQTAEYEVIFDTSATNGTEVGDTLSNDDISIVFNKGTNSNASKYYGNGTEIRCYQGNTLTISSTYTITKIEFNATVIKNGGMFESNIPTLGSLSDNTLIWEGSYNEIIFTTISTTGSTSGQFKLFGIKITYLQ